MLDFSTRFFIRYTTIGFLLYLAVGLALVSAAEFNPGEKVSFEKIWNLALHDSPGLKAAHEDFLAAQVGALRAERHWYPRAYLTGRAFSTNDPGTSFMYSLEQRQITSSDFNPSLLNQPGSSFFEQATLGLDLPLYEGGARVAQSKAARSSSEAKGLESKAEAIRDYVSLAASYVGILNLRDEISQLRALKVNVESIISQYRVGSRSNPVGYSGLLGLKNLKNRIEALVIESEAQESEKKAEIKSIVLNLPDEWSPSEEETGAFLKRYLSTAQGNGVPIQVQAAMAGSESMGHLKDGEKAKFLPKIGLFAEGDFFAGSRATANSYSSGAYLQWDLFSATNFGAVEQAEHSAAAASARASQLQARVSSEHTASSIGLIAVERNLKLLDESAELLEEQTRTAAQLFRSGSINALQLAEVLNRRVDLLINRLDAQMKQAELSAVLYRTSSETGVPNEFNL